MMFNIPPTLSMDLVLRRQAELQAAAEQHRRKHPASSRHRRSKRTRVLIERSSAQQRRRITRHGWLAQRRHAALKQS